MQLVLANILERVLGLDPGFFNREGELGIDFNPHWPGPDALTPYWNLLLGVGALLWVGLLVYAGYFFGNAPIVKDNFSIVIIAIVVISILPAAWEILRRRSAPGSSTRESV